MLENLTIDKVEKINKFEINIINDKNDYDFYKRKLKFRGEESNYKITDLQNNCKMYFESLGNLIDFLNFNKYNYCKGFEVAVCFNSDIEVYESLYFIFIFDRI